MDAAVALQRRGHSVELFTSRHDPTRCFAETRDGQLTSRQRSCPSSFHAHPALFHSPGTLKTHVLGDSLPRSIFQSLHIILAILRQLHLTFALLLSLSPLVPESLQPIPKLGQFDVFFVDQLSVCVPLLRWVLQTRVVFYCHFPDKLLSGGWDVSVEGTEAAGRPQKKEAVGLKEVLKGLYRIPVDTVEEFSTG